MAAVRLHHRTSEGPRNSAICGPRWSAEREPNCMLRQMNGAAKSRSVDWKRGPNLSAMRYLKLGFGSNLEKSFTL
ncbi:hypothetical protein CEXT_772911 [Caerostris extrusa]|uniref:Uncharacterized protein n=1 Tax=Caerostris extrusa TaxID=172846 RepID=A0AAV4UMT0_CAEEX|nr:hypothetical protein CEXT_772911 [Caerostris extrusa]